MKIYFAGSIRGGREDVELYLQIIEHLKKYGEVLTEHVGNKNLALMGEDGLADSEIYARDMNWLNQSDVLVAEVSTPSTGVGHELGDATRDKKRILCLYRPQEGRRLSAMVAGNPHLTVRNYNSLDEAKKSIDDFFKVD